jgi:hypothetical protein
MQQIARRQLGVEDAAHDAGFSLGVADLAGLVDLPAAYARVCDMWGRPL